MADRYLLESSSVDGYQLEDGSGVILLEIDQPPGWMTTRPAPAVLRLAVAGAVAFAMGFPPPADAGDGTTDGQLYANPTIHNPGIAGPMVVGEPLSWQPRVIVGTLPQRAGSVGYAAPLSVTAPPAVNWWYPRTPDAVLPSKLTSSLFAQPVTVPATPGINWIFQRPPDAARTAVPPNSSVLVQPPDEGFGWWYPKLQDPVARPPQFYPTIALPVTKGSHSFLLPQDAARLLLVTRSLVALPSPRPSDLPWLPPGLPVIQPQYPTRSIVTLPLQGSFELPWLLTGAPLVPQQYARQSVFALNPTTPAPQVVFIPWLIPPGQLVFRPVARYEAVYAKPVQPQDPDGRSDLPWLLTGAPLVRPLYLYQSSLALNPTTPSAPVTLPWVTQTPSGRITPLTVLSQLVTPFSPMSELPWTLQPQLVLRQIFTGSQIVAPTRVQIDTGWLTQLPANVRQQIISIPQFVKPVFTPFEHGWTPYVATSRPLPIVGVSRLVSPIQPLDPAGRSDLPWLITNIAQGRFAIPPTRSQLVVVFSEALAEPGVIYIPGSYQGIVYIAGSYYAVISIPGSSELVLYIPGDFD